MQSDNHYIAIGNDNANGLKRWHLLSSPLFQHYRRGIETVWHEGEGRELDGDRRLHLIGLPWVEYKFPYLTEAEWNYIKGTLCNSTPDAEMTIRTFNGATWGNYNAVLELPEEVTFKDGLYTDVVLKCRDLDAILA